MCPHNQRRISTDIAVRYDDEIIKKVELHQKERDNNGDFYSQAKSDMEHLEIFEEDFSHSKHKFKETLKMQKKIGRHLHI